MSTWRWLVCYEPAFFVSCLRAGSTKASSSEFTLKITELLGDIQIPPVRDLFRDTYQRAKAEELDPHERSMLEFQLIEELRALVFKLNQEEYHRRENMEKGRLMQQASQVLSQSDIQAI